MNTQFKCNSCNLIFQADGKKIEYMDPIYGACSKTVSNCPDCKLQSSEYTKPKPIKLASKSNVPPCAMGGGCACR